MKLKIRIDFNDWKELKKTEIDVLNQFCQTK